MLSRLLPEYCNVIFIKEISGSEARKAGHGIKQFFPTLSPCVKTNSAGIDYLADLFGNFGNLFI